jgi:hypothetical protein
MFSQSKKFFSSPVEEKEPCKITENVRASSPSPAAGLTAAE